LLVAHDFQGDIGNSVQDRDRDSVLVEYAEERRLRFFPGDTENPRRDLANAFMKDTKEQRAQQYDPDIDDGAPTEKRRESFN
jgi:hypothetical protein